MNILLNSSKVSRHFFQKRWLMQDSKLRLDLFYDVASPYSWFAFEVLFRYKNIWNIDLHLMPILLGAIFKESGNTSVPRAKVLHSDDDVRRCAKFYDVPLIPVKSMKELISKGTLTPMRVLTAVDITRKDFLEDVSRSFWMHRWNKDEDITTLEGIKKVAEMSRLIEVMDLEEIMKMVAEDCVKQRLKQNTELTLQYGAFGVPTMVLHRGEQRELFFGADRLPIVAQQLNEPWLGPTPKC